MKKVKLWLKYAGIRALKTVAQTALSMVTVGQAVMEVDWIKVLSVSAVAGFISILTSVGGIPEMKNYKAEDGQDV